MNETSKSDVNARFEKKYQVGDSYLLNVLEVNNPHKQWKKVFGEIHHIKSKDEVISCHEKVVLFIETMDDTLQVGDELALNCDLLPILNKGNPGEFDSEFYYKSKGINKIGFVAKRSYIKKGNSITWITKWSLKSRDYLGDILERHFKGQELALAQALILGDRSFLDPETTTDFGNSGAMHVLAVSGLHIGIILQIILYILKYFSRLISRNQALIIALFLIWMYTFISGLSASVLRSTFMFSVLAISQLNGKNYNALNSLFFTCFVLLLINPLFLFDIGFQLSCLAMLGIFWFYQPISKWIFIRNKWLRKIWEGTAVGIAAQFVTVPLTLFYFHQFPNYFILTNIGLMFSTGLILGFGMFVFSFSWLKYFGKWAIFLLSIILFLTLEFVSFIDDLPGSVATGFQLHWGIVLFSFSVIIGIYLMKNSNEKILLGFFISAFFIVFYVTYQRYVKLNYREICFFNHAKATFIVKDCSAIFCFYDGEKADIEKLKFIINSYAKVYPGDVRYFSIHQNDWNIKRKGLSIAVNHLKTGFNIEINEQAYFLKSNSYEAVDGLQKKNICLPWVEPSLKTDYLLKESAVRFVIK